MSDTTNNRAGGAAGIENWGRAYDAGASIYASFKGSYGASIGRRQTVMGALTEDLRDSARSLKAVAGGSKIYGYIVESAKAGKAGKGFGAFATTVTVASDITANRDRVTTAKTSKERAQAVARTGSDIAVDIAVSKGCIAAGAAIGTIVGGPFGAAVGVMAGMAIDALINWKFIGEPPVSIVEGVKMVVGSYVEGLVGFIGDRAEAVAKFFNGPANWRDSYGQNRGPQDRDFTEATKENLLGIVSKLEEEWGGVADYVGDMWKAVGLPTPKDYTTKLLDIKNTSKSDIERIFDEVSRIDTSFVGAFNGSRDVFRTAHKDLQALCDRIKA